MVNSCGYGIRESHLRDVDVFFLTIVVGFLCSEIEVEGTFGSQVTRNIEYPFSVDGSFIRWIVLSPAETTFTLEDALICGVVRPVQRVNYADTDALPRFFFDFVREVSSV